MKERYPTVSVGELTRPTDIWGLGREMVRVARLARCALQLLDPGDGGPEHALIDGALEALPWPGGRLLSAASPVVQAGWASPVPYDGTSPKTPEGPLLSRSLSGAVYVRINRMGVGSSGVLRAQLNEVRFRPDRHGMILDLRGCPGGLLAEGIDVADIFLRAGKVIQIRSRLRALAEKTSPPSHSGRFPLEEKHAVSTVDDVDAALVVLVDHTTAGSAELVAAALQQRDRALVVGEETYGDGIVTLIYDLPSGAHFSLPMADLIAPDGATLHGRGVTPDVTSSGSAGSPDSAVTLAEAILARAKGTTRQALRAAASLR